MPTIKKKTSRYSDGREGGGREAGSGRRSRFLDEHKNRKCKMIMEIRKTVTSRWMHKQSSGFSLLSTAAQVCSFSLSACMSN